MSRDALYEFKKQVKQVCDMAWTGNLNDSEKESFFLYVMEQAEDELGAVREDRKLAEEDDSIED
mgnify:CR=1 FL=1